VLLSFWWIWGNIRDAGEWVHNEGIVPMPFHKGATGAKVPFYKSIRGNFMVYQDRFETNSLQLFAHPETSEWFSIIYVFIFEANIFAEQKEV